MLAELFQLDEPPEDGGESLRANGSEDSYSDDDREQDEEDVEDEGELSEESDDSGPYTSCSNPQDDSKAVAVIRSVGELSVPEKYRSTHQIRVGITFVNTNLRVRRCIKDFRFFFFFSIILQPNCAFPVSQDKEERCRHVLNYVLKVSVCQTCSTYNGIC